MPFVLVLAVYLSCLVAAITALRYIVPKVSEIRAVRLAASLVVCGGVALATMIFMQGTGDLSPRGLASEESTERLYKNNCREGKGQIGSGGCRELAALYERSRRDAEALHYYRFECDLFKSCVSFNRVKTRLQGG